MSFIMLILTQIFISAAFSQFYCKHPMQCVGQIIDTQDDYIVGGGYRSLYGNTTSITLSSTVNYYYLDCKGAFSCSQCDKISWKDQYAKIYCDGSNSCSDIRSIETTSANFIECGGSNSCSRSHFIDNGSGNVIQCYADQSCAKSIIQGFSTVNGLGAYSLLNASIYNNGTALIVNLQGYKAGLGTTIYCESVLCVINCYGNACDYTSFICNPNCDISYHYILSLTDDESLLYDSGALTINNDNQCNQEPNSVTIDTESAYNDDTWYSYSIYGGPICSRGAEALGMTQEVHNNLSSSVVVCGGRYSCDDRKLKIYAVDGPVFCEGAHACGSGEITTTNRVYCLGRQACDHLTIYNSSDIYNIYEVDNGIDYAM
eukprot:231998_1